LQAIDLIPRGLALLAVNLGTGRAHQPAGGAVHDGHCHLQIAQQFGAWCCCLGLLPLRFEKQLRLGENSFPNQRRALAPGSIQMPGLPRVAVILGEHCGHPLAVLQAHARHRHQKLHGHMRGDPALAHLLLDGLWQKLDQCQPPRHPAHAAVKPARQIIQSIAETLLHLLQQPALLQRGFPFGEAQRTVQQQSLGFGHRPDHRFHRVLAQLLERRQALVAVDHQVTARLAFGGHHHDGRLLPRISQRGQQPPLTSRMAHPEMLPAPVELVKLQLHGLLPRRDSVCGRRELVFLRRLREVCWELSWDQAYTRGTGLSRNVPGVLP
jgi:hypothetical protein